MTKSTGERISRACTRCRQRKTKCDLDSTGVAGLPPCVSCQLDGQDCVLAGSRRGGDYSHLRRKNKSRSRGQPRDQVNRTVPVSHDAKPTSARQWPQHQARELSEENITGLQNPLEALQILVQAAESSQTSPERNPAISSALPDHDQGGGLPTAGGGTPTQAASGAAMSGLGLGGFRPDINDLLDANLLHQLSQHFLERYHPFMPIVSEDLLLPQNIQRTAREEPFLTTAILAISTKSRVDLELLQRSLWSYIRSSILDVVLGTPDVAHVGSVEALLLLAEWVPHAHIGSTSSKLNTSGEDGAAWSLVGLAVRQAYLLHLDKYGFRLDSTNEPRSLSDRKRLAWTYTYLSDRQISIRMGQAFWCRGPGSSARFSAEDYPTLQPSHAYNEDYASILIAEVELTTIFGNVHDILYASKHRTVNLMLVGDYTKYLDDSLRALAAWKDAWDRIKVSQHLKCLLDMQHDYLSLYINAFGFHAVICRSLEQSRASSSDNRRPSFFPNGPVACPDTKYIYSSMESASALLKVMSDRIDPVKYTRYLPVRYYLYAIHAAVFLFRAYTLGATSKENHQRSVRLVVSFLSTLETAADDEQHIAARYKRLLSGLWLRTENTSQGPGQAAPENAGDNTRQTPNHLDTDAGDNPQGLGENEYNVPSQLFDTYAFAYEGILTDFGLGGTGSTAPFGFTGTGMPTSDRHPFLGYPTAGGMLGQDVGDPFNLFPPGPNQI